MKRILPLFLIGFISLVNAVNGQSIPNATPSSSIKQQVGISELTVSYRRANVQARQIRTGKNAFLPEHKIWNTSIVLTLNTPFSIGDTVLESGKYTLSASPNNSYWTMIFKKVNADTDVQEEVLQLSVKEESIPFTETLEVRLTNITDSAALLSVLWDTFCIPIPITVPTNELVLNSYKQALLNNESGHGNTLQYGTWFLLTRDFEIPLALEWISKDIQHEETYFNTWLKAQVLRRLNRNNEALETAQKALDLALVSSDFDFQTYVPRIRTALDFWGNNPNSTLLVKR